MSRFSIGETVMLKSSYPREEVVILNQHPLYENCYEVEVKKKRAIFIVHQSFIAHMFEENDVQNS